MSTEPTRATRVDSAQVWLLGKCSPCGTPLVREEQGPFGQRWHYHEVPAEPAPEPPRPPAEVHPGATGTPNPTTGRGTGEAGPETSAQAATLRDASASIHTIADHMPDIAHPEFVRGVRYAATLLGHTATDLTEGATS